MEQRHFFILGICLVILGADCLQWTGGPAEGATLYACAGEPFLLLAWSYGTSPGVLAVNDVEWTHDAGREEEGGAVAHAEMIAFLTNGVFVPLSQYAQRLQYVPNAGLRLDGLTVADYGTFRVQVTASGVSGETIIIRRSVAVHVSDGLMTDGGSLHASVRDGAVLDSGQRWTLELRCGHFFFDDPPLHDVDWITPSGQTLPSNGYSDGHFLLHLPVPLAPGRYTCRVASHSPHNCARTEAEASVAVDVTSARLALLEAELGESKAQLGRAEGRLADMQGRLGQAEVRLNAALARLAGSEEDVASVQQQLKQAQDQLSRLEGRVTRDVSFHAQSLLGAHHAAGAPLVVHDVLTNRGGYYSGETGRFTAPANGTYFFTATTGPWGAGQAAGVWVMVEGAGVALGQSRGEALATVSVVAWMGGGQGAWLKAANTGDYWMLATTFSGFVLALDP